MYKIAKEFHFSASHVLNGLEEGHPCGRLHGHNYVFIFELYGRELTNAGFLRDYHSLDVVKKYIDATLDHRHLNDVFPFQPSAENMAKAMYDMWKPQFPDLHKVSVKETPKTIASYVQDK